MRTFLSVAAGTDEPAKFLEIIYKGATEGNKDETDVAFVGKGITFDSGGISLKPGAGEWTGIGVPLWTFCALRGWICEEALNSLYRFLPPISRNEGDESRYGWCSHR